MSFTKKANCHPEPAAAAERALASEKRRRTAKDLELRCLGQERRCGLSLIFFTKTTVSLLPQALPLEILRRPPPHFARYASLSGCGRLRMTSCPVWRVLLHNLFNMTVLPNNLPLPP